MRLDPPPVPFPADADLRAALDDVDVAPLLAMVAHVTGDLSVLRDDLRPVQAQLIEPEYGIAPHLFAVARDLAAERLQVWIDDGGHMPPSPDPEALRRIIGFLAGDAVSGDYLQVLTEELALDGADLRAPQWHKDDLDADRPFRVAIVGAGMSGIAAAHRLRQAGVPFEIFEKNADVGGTWYENTYPGCRVDVPNHLYSFSFAQSPDWPQFFSTQEVLLDYFRTCTDELGLRPAIRFGTEVVGATFDEESSRWTVTTRPAGADGPVEFHVVDAVISAVGQLNRPKMPDLPGLDAFRGEAFHSARWRHDLDLRGKRVAVIGTGASALQFLPTVAEDAVHLTIFQRTPPWLAPSPTYHDDLPAGLQLLLRHLPVFARWDRLWLFWRLHESLLPAAIVDPEWPDQRRSVSLLNEFVRLLLTEHITASFEDPALAAAATPSYPPIAKRVVRDNGIWPRTLERSDVDLVTTAISEITPEGVRTADGVEHEVDVLIYGTGFEASEFLTPMAVRGRGGVDLHQRWDGDARAFLGVTIPDFPNLFLLYGPNTNIVINGSIIYFSECGVHYIVECIRMLLDGGHRTLDCRAEVHDAFNADVDATNRTMVWGAADVNSWYRNAHGRVAQNWPYSLLEYWQRTRHPEPDHYVLD